MAHTIEVTTRVLPGHRIEIEAPELPEGDTVTVRITLDEEETPKRPLREVLAGYPGRTALQDRRRGGRVLARGARFVGQVGLPSSDFRRVSSLNVIVLSEVATS